MVRAQAGNHFLFGITEENVRRLKQGQPLLLTLNEHGMTGPPVSIIVCYGDTEEKLVAELQEWIGPTTRVEDRRKPR